MSSNDLARRIRVDSLRTVHKARASHIGSSLSIADILAVLYEDILRSRPAEPAWPDRDRLIVSKGHAAAAVYAALANRGFFPRDWLDTYCADGSRLAGHITHGVPGVELSTGSLGHGLPVAAGLAVAAHRGALSWRVFALLSDGDCDEGSTWEAALFAAHHRLEKLTAIVDYNRIQGFGRVGEVLELDPLGDKWRAFGWGVVEVDGHDHGALRTALEGPAQAGRPTAVIAHTVKGKGVGFMEDRLEWHYKSPTDEQLLHALRGLGEDG